MKKNLWTRLQNSLLFLFCFSQITFAQTAAQKSKKPNILWIITDDQRKDSNGYYNEIVTGKKDSPLGYIESPNLDALAKEGVVFTNIHCNSPACAPSRTSIISGKYPHHSGVYGFEYYNSEPSFSTKILPQVMNEQGYETSYFGKAGYRNKSVDNIKNLFFQRHITDNQLSNAGFTDWNKRAFWGKINGKSEQIDTKLEFYYPNGEKKDWSTTANASEKDKLTRQTVEKELDILYGHSEDMESTLIYGGVNSMPGDKTLDGYTLNEFSNYLKNQDTPYKNVLGKATTGANSKAPIFSALGFHFPHTPVMPPKEFRDRFKDKVYKIPEFDKKLELSKLPKQLVDMYNKLTSDNFTYQEKQQAIRDYYAFCAYGDYIVGKAVADFKAYSKKNNQEYMIVYLCGDHGWQLGEQGIESKFTPWDLSTHTSAIIVSSDKTKYPAGKVYKGLAEYVDIMPTILAAGGVDLSAKEYDYLDGYDLGAMLNDKKLSKDYIVGEINCIVGPRAYIKSKDFSFSMQTRKNRGQPSPKFPPNVDIKWGIDAPREEVQMALYDLRKDPLERNNLANDKAYKALADWFRLKLGNIVLGDGRIECDWKNNKDFNKSDFALGSDDKKLVIPTGIIPK